ncbi:MAG: TonB-dependent receptor [Muribaculaceae bacterium]|nr:TonB-dependent receptor [Muribaculaceae bacterium]
MTWAVATFMSFSAMADEPSDSISTYNLEDYVVTKRRPSTFALSGPETGFKVGQDELFKAACCNLGESFTTNPSVDVDYADPATGAKQIKLLGLAGTYVQMMSENIPDFRGAAAPFAFRYVPGPWLKSIRVSKGASTVKNGYEAITGQIDVEYLKPQDDPGVTLNAYFDSDTRLEANADANFNIVPGLNMEVLGHAENRFSDHDSNGNGFADSPSVRQFNFMNRWNYFSERYIMHAGFSTLSERSRAGQIVSHHGHRPENPFLINLDTYRYQAYMKHALVFDRDHGTNLALIASASMHQLDGLYGIKSYSVNEKNVYAQLMFEHDFSESHNISAGASINYDYLGQHIVAPDAPGRLRERETTPGLYAQYTFRLAEQLSVMAGIRGDHSSSFGWFATPRFNLKWTPVDGLDLHASVGKGYRTVHPWAEYNYLLASGRQLVVEQLQQEAAWTYGANVAYTWHLNSEQLKFNIEYFYTDFKRQAIVDYDSDLSAITIAALKGKSFSHTAQFDVTYTSSFGLSATAAYRLNDVKATYGGTLLSKPLTSRYKALLTLSYKTPLELWQFDATFVLNGGGRMPAPYRLPNGEMSWNDCFPAFPSLNLQVTRWFRHFSIYAGGENLTGFRQKNPIVWASDPWSNAFDPTVIWGPIHGAMAYIGIRFNFGR